MGSLLLACIIAAVLAAGVAIPHTHAAVAVEEATAADLTVTVVPDRLKWGEETEVVVSAVNSTGSTLAGGIYVSFDEDVLVLDVKDGTLLRPGAFIFDLKTSVSRRIARPVVESWERAWKPGIQRRVVLTVLPLARERVRVHARLTLILSTQPPRIGISPGRLESRSLDEAGFPAQVGFVWISRHTSLRRAIRRIERRIRNLEDSEQRRFAYALADAMDDPKALVDLLGDTASPELQQFRQSLILAAPRIVERLRGDPIVALDHLRCLMANLSCQRALLYYGVPKEFYKELSAEEAARLEAKKRIENEKGGNELIALLEAEGFVYRREKKPEAIIVQLDGGTSVKVETRGVFARELLERIVAALGSAAERTHPEANGLSFALLLKQLGGSTPAGPPASPSK
jgi:prefoldin subunit 5